MNRSTKRGLIGVVLAAALGAMALVALTGGAAAQPTDRNHDRIPDRWEKRHHLSLKVDQARRDQDRDHLRNRGEFLAGDNPRNDDSDGDGVIDGDEQAGTIASFDSASGKLVIDLFGADTISGLVSEDTRIKCEDAEHHNRGEHRLARSGESEPGDDHGGHGEEEPGDDNGGEAAGSCGTAALEPGAVVQEAELHVVGGKAVFEEVELAH
ncbi:MAG TPA: hypothetical protein VMT37_03185 [Solirubrobacterales bacterium]|nr:hypothetical protein [Solirubrobacterales bacterium]